MCKHQPYPLACRVEGVSNNAESIFRNYITPDCVFNIQLNGFYLLIPNEIELFHYIH